MKSFPIILAFVGCLAIENGITNYLLVEVEEDGRKDLPRDPAILPGPPIDKKHLIQDPKSTLRKKSVKSCCKENGVAAMCLGLCTGAKSLSARQFSSRWESACKRFDDIIEMCYMKSAEEKGSIRAKGITQRVDRDVLFLQ